MEPSSGANERERPREQGPRSWAETDRENTARTMQQAAEKTPNGRRQTIRRLVSALGREKACMGRLIRPS